MFFQKKKAPSIYSQETDNTENFKSLTESLYKHNLELSVKNKTLSLLRQLYQVSLQTLEPEALGKKITETILEALELEFVGVFLLQDELNKLAPLATSRSGRLRKVESEMTTTLGCTIPNLSQNKFFSSLIKFGKDNYTENLGEVWGNCISPSVILSFKEKAHTRTTSAHPLIINGKIFGFLVLCMNKRYETLNDFEKESIMSIVSVVALALDKSFLYHELDLTNSKLSSANDRLKELDQLKSEFVSLATHQIRAPLTAIKGYISMIHEGDYGPVSKEVTDALKIVFESTNNLVTIVGDFLDVSRIEQGKMKYDFTEFNIEELVKQVITEYKPNIDRIGLALHYDAPTGKNFMVNGDRGKIKQIIGNIIDNSIKYTPKGEINVSLSENNAKILIKIADTGVGIPPKTMPLLFQKFTRAKNANEANILGTGLGLYVAKMMIEAHKGKIWATSEGEGKGSQFYIGLDAIQPNSKPAKIVDQKLKGITISHSSASMFK
ncbi:HAMP domain-containing histidine kinase [Candidatus Parcubacteria bacterium]|nr:HAMP domain-containing histidine kinase [Candidatus Parcubacteria bacterium]